MSPKVSSGKRPCEVCVVPRDAAFSAFRLRWMDARAHLFTSYGLRHALFGRCVHLRHGF